jgi:hypothetical protein
VKSDIPVVFISGPIDPNNIEKSLQRFKEAEEWLLANGYQPLNPIELTSVCKGAKLTSRVFWLRKCIMLLMECDHITYLEGAEKSKGSLLERNIAEQLEITEIKRKVTE